MNDTERLLAIESIKQTKARYFRFMDTKDWAALPTVFAADAQMDMRGETGDDSGLITGAENIAAFMRSSVEFLITVHHGHTSEIEILSSTNARGIWAMEDKLWKPEGSKSTLPFAHLHGYGHYHETYSRIDGQWLIQSTKLTRLHLEIF
ncbi:MAG TPA: nuclear transport factor 2 family protein [Spongiibacteraceae bacterium]|nr:nuclear transport factor 2 family protein [Spongiibacteraceae bacterium]